MPRKGKGIYQKKKKPRRKYKKTYEENSLRIEKENEDDHILEKMRTPSISNLCKGKITEADTRRNEIAGRNQWLDLPRDLVSHIAEGLGLIDLMSFRGVCKEWRSASSKASAQIESLQEEPWFLLYGQGSCECSLLSNQDKIYTLNMPELDGATCLKSRGGWLLLFADGGSMFFFCPFSRARIELPKCPLPELSGHITAAFSYDPTSPDCCVALLKQHIRDHGLELELHWLHRGDDLWSGRKCPLSPDIKTTRTYIDKDKYFLEKNIRGKLGLKANVSVSTCGTAILRSNASPILIRSEDIEADSDSDSDSQGAPEGRHLKGVWIQPRYFQISPDQTW